MHDVRRRLAPDHHASPPARDTRGSSFAGLLTLSLVAVACGDPPLHVRATPRVQLLPAALAAPSSAAEARGGYWLSVDLLGPAAAQQAAVVEMSEGLPLRDPSDLPPPGIMVGHVSEVSEAIRWMARHVFEPRPTPPAYPLALQRVPAPAPAGGLIRRHGATLVAFVVSGATPDLRPRTIEWPMDQSAIIPSGSTWQPGALVPNRAPLFAAPAPAVPPAAEAHGMAVRRGGLFVLSWIDRCEESPSGPRCLRWAQVVVRDGDRFTPGYLPMFQVALRTAWVRGEGALPRAQLIATQHWGDRAAFVLLARGRDNQLHRRTLRTPASADGWPRSSLQVTGDVAIVTLGDEPPLHLALDPTLDARPPRQRAEGETDDSP